MKRNTEDKFIEKHKLIHIKHTKDQCTWFTQSLGYVHQTCHIRWHLLKIKGYNPQQPCCCTFLLSLRPRLSYESISNNGDTGVKQEYSPHSSKEHTLEWARINSRTKLALVIQHLVGQNPINLHVKHVHHLIERKHWLPRIQNDLMYSVLPIYQAVIRSKCI